MQWGCDGTEVADKQSIKVSKPKKTVYDLWVLTFEGSIWTLSSEIT